MKSQRQLTWQFFWEQKREEIWRFAQPVAWILLIFLVIPTIIGSSAVSIFDLTCADFYDDGRVCSNGDDILNMWLLGSLSEVTLAMVVIPAWIWLHNNWKRAKRRAEEEVKLRSKSKRRLNK